MVCEESSFCLVGDSAENSPLAGNFSRRHLSLRKKGKKKWIARRLSKANERRINEDVENIIRAPSVTSQAQQGCSLRQALGTLWRHFHTNSARVPARTCASKSLYCLGPWHYDSSFPVLNISWALDTTTPFLY